MMRISCAQEVATERAEKELFSYTTESALWRNAGPNAYQLHETMLKSGKLLFTCAVVFYVKLRNFWTPLVNSKWRHRYLTYASCVGNLDIYTQLDTSTKARVSKTIRLAASTDCKLRLQITSMRQSVSGPVLLSLGLRK